MSDYKNLLNFVKNDDVVGFRDAFKNVMNNKMSNLIQVKLPETPTNESVDNTEDEKEESENDDNSDTYILPNVDTSITKARDIIDNYNSTHPENRLNVKVFKKDIFVNFFVSGDPIARKMVKNLIRGIGGKYKK